jgi:hypothetical protein
MDVNGVRHSKLGANWLTTMQNNMEVSGNDMA